MPKPMTLPEMCRAAAVVLETSNDRAKALMAVEHTLQEVQMALYRERPGLDVDRMLGASPYTTEGEIAR